MVVSAMRVSTDIPEDRAELQRLAVAHNWPDMLEGLSQVRNSIVHPQANNRESFSAAGYEAWEYSIWILELAILHFIGYQGTYANRITQRFVGTVEKVPWAQEMNNGI